MLEQLSNKVADLFGEHSHGVNRDYCPFHEIGAGDEFIFKYLPYDTFDREHQLFINRGSTGFVLLGSPVAGANLETQGKLNSFFKTPGNLPPGCSMQFLLVASPRIKGMLDFWQSYRKHPDFVVLAKKTLRLFK